MATSSEKQAAFNSMMTKGWQSPYVDVFRHFAVGRWQKSAKQGEVSEVTDKTLRAKVYRISGAVPASNYIQLPKASSHSLGLVGQYLYLEFRVIPRRHFVVHVDIATVGGLVVRVSISNLFKEFKATSTWLQFPFVDITPRWTLLVLDLKTLLRMYVNRQFLYTKGIRLCANMYVRNIFTSENNFDERKLPRALDMFRPKDTEWHDLYDCIRFPFVLQTHEGLGTSVAPGNTEIRRAPVDEQQVPATKAVAVRAPRSAGAAVVRHNRKSAPATAAANPEGPSTLPTVGLNLLDLNPASDHSRLQAANQDLRAGAVEEQRPAPTPPESVLEAKVVVEETPAKEGGKSNGVPARQPLPPSLDPDPIMSMRGLVGFASEGKSSVAWSGGDATLAFAAGHTVVLLDTASGAQEFLRGHTADVTSVSAGQAAGVLATAQGGTHPCVRLWDVAAQKTTGFVPLDRTPIMVELSKRGSSIAVVTRDTGGKHWIAALAVPTQPGRAVSRLAEAAVGASVDVVRVSPLDERRYATCGRDGVRLWRIKDGAFRSCPVNLAGHTHPGQRYTDLQLAPRGSAGLTAFVSSTAGEVIEVDCMSARLIRRHHVTGPEGGAALCLALVGSYCVVGSADRVLRVWPLDFGDYVMDLEHDGSPCSLSASADGQRVAVATAAGSLGVLDLEAPVYKTVLRAHTDVVVDCATSPQEGRVATVSRDGFTRVWDANTLALLYEFCTPGDAPLCVTYHPRDDVLAVGYTSGHVRVFSVASTTEVTHIRQHKAPVVAIKYSADCRRFLSVGQDGLAVRYDVLEQYRPQCRRVFEPARAGHPLVFGFSASGSHMAVACRGEQGDAPYVLVAEGINLEEEARLGLPGTTAKTVITAVAFTPDNLSLLIASGAQCGRSGTLTLARIATGAVAARHRRAHRGDIRCLDIDRTGTLALSAGDDGTVHVWDAGLPEGCGPQRFTSNCGGPATRVAFASRSRLVLSCCGSSLSLWRLLAKPRDTIMPAATQAAGATSALAQTSPPLADVAPSQPQSSTSSAHVDSLDLADLTSTAGPSQPSPPTGEARLRNGVAPEPRVTTGEEARLRNGVAPEPRVTFAGPASVLGRGEGRGTASAGDQHINRDQPEDSTANTQGPIMTTADPLAAVGGGDLDVLQGGCPPCVACHYAGSPSSSALASKLYRAPAGQAALEMAHVFGINFRGPQGVTWHPQTGILAYASGQTVVIDNLQSREQRFLLQHTEEVSAARVSHDGCTVASACGPTAATQGMAQVCIWDVATGSLIDQLLYHINDVQALAFSRDDRLLVSAGNYKDPSIAVWELATGSLLAASQADQPVNAVAWDPNVRGEFAAVGQDGTILFFFLDEGQDAPSRHTLQHHCVLNVFHGSMPAQFRSPNGGPVHFTSLEFAENNTLYVGDSTGVVSVWDTTNNTCFKSWQADSAEVTTIVARGGRLVTGGASRSIRVWLSAAEADGPFVQEDEMPVDGTVTALHFDAVLAMGVVATAAGTVWVLDWTVRQKVRLASGHTGQLRGLAVSQDGRYVASAAEDGSVRVWSVDMKEQVMHFQVVNVNDAVCNCVAFSPDTQRCVAGYTDGVLRLFDLGTVDLEAKFNPHERAVTAAAFSRDGRVVLSANSGGLVVVSSASTGMTVRVIADHKGSPVCGLDMALAPPQYPDATSLWLAVSCDQRISVWQANWEQDFCEMVDWLSIPTSPFVPTEELTEMPPTLARFSPADANVVLFTSFAESRQLSFYNVRQRKVIKRLSLSDWALSMSLAPAGHLIAVGTQHRLLKLIDFEQGTFQDYAAHSDSVGQVCFGGNGDLLFSTGHDDIIVWKVLL